MKVKALSASEIVICRQKTGYPVMSDNRLYVENTVCVVSVEIQPTFARRPNQK